VKTDSTDLLPRPTAATAKLSTAVSEGTVSGGESSFRTPPHSALKAAKLAVLRAAHASGFSGVVRDSRWRSDRLLILAYHGVSSTDEHEWKPELYLPPHALRERFSLLKKDGYNVLSLRDAVDRLRNGTLPPRSVSLTFDDGITDFQSVALPLLQEFGFPATVYVTSYYSGKEVPVFRLASRYLLWKGRDREISGVDLVGPVSHRLNLRSPHVRSAVALELEEFVRASGGGIEREMATLRLIAERVGADFDELLRSRRLRIMSAEQIRSLPDDLIDVQLHTHRHRVPLDRELFRQEVQDNRRYLEPLRPNSLMDGFCYPSGITNEKFLPWLQELGIHAAMTCRPGLASAKSDLLLLPRVVDSWHLSLLEFEGWLTGVSHALPRFPGPSEPVTPD